MARDFAFSSPDASTKTVSANASISCLVLVGIAVIVRCLSCIMSDDGDATSAMRQRLMQADEVYIYKIPPLKNAGGHR